MFIVVKIEIRCPACAKKGYLEIEENVVTKATRGITAVNVAEFLICDHSFVAYIDKNLSVRDCFLADFQIELPSMKTKQDYKEDKIPEKEDIDIDLLIINIPAITLTYLIRACLFNKKVLFLLEEEFLYAYFEKLFNYIFKDTFEIAIKAETNEFYKKNKKQFKDYVVLDTQKVINDKQKILDPKRIKIERTIIQKFIGEMTQKSSLIIIKNEIQKAYELSKDLHNFLKNLDKREKLTPKLVNNHFKEEYGQNISDYYLRFLINIVKYNYNLNISSMLSFNDLIPWNWYLK